MASDLVTAADAQAQAQAQAQGPPVKQAGEKSRNQKTGESKIMEPKTAQTSAPKEVTAADGHPSDVVSSITSLGDSASSKGSEVEQEAAADPAVYFPQNNFVGLYYPGPGYEMVHGEWEEPSAFMGPMDGLEIAYQGIQADNGMVYYLPGYAYPPASYSPYNPYIAGTLYDGGIFAPQPYYSAAPLFQQPLTSPAYFQPPVAYGSEIPPAFTWDAGAPVLDRPNNGVPAVSRTSHLVTSSIQQPFVKPTQTAKKSISQLDTKGSAPVSDGLQPSLPSATQTGPGDLNSSGVQGAVQTVKPATKPLQLPKGYVTVGKVLPPSNQPKPNGLFSTPGDIKSNGHEWIGSDRLKIRGKINGNGNMDALNEQNRGPRITKVRSPWSSSPTDGAMATQVSLEHAEGSTPVVDKNRYNLPDFPTNYENALFFVIKSYSEDDVHKSIKYNVWASTPNGNKRLDSAFQTAQERSGQQPGGCPVFLFFSVNASGQFCGVAEMTGSVDFSRSMTFWQQDKWNGFFPVKWHIIKDVPNGHFRHIILENNDNKPVTNSRDTQEITFHKGIEMLNIFKSYSARTSILDDFLFYEERQKAMQDKKQQMVQEDRFQAAVLVDGVQNLALGDQFIEPDHSVRLSSLGDSKDGHASQPEIKGTALEQVPGGTRKEPSVSIKSVESKNDTKNEIKRLNLGTNKRE